MYFRAVAQLWPSFCTGNKFDKNTNLNRIIRLKVYRDSRLYEDVFKQVKYREKTEEYIQ